MKHFVNRGNTIQLNWTLHSISGQEFALTGHTYKLFFATGNQSAQATGVTHSGNVLSWTFTPNAQWKLGSYTIWLEVYANGTKIVTVAYPDAFHLAHEVASDGTTQTGTQTESTTLNLVSSCDFYRFAPVVPVAGEDGYWYVNGEKAVDGSGEYILTSHTLEYDEQTRNLIIDRGRVDSEGNSIEQVITALADLDSYYQAAEGSAAGSEAGDGSRWGSYKTAENARNTAAQNAETARQTAANNAEGTKNGSTAGDGSRWGEFKSAEDERNTAADTAVARANAAAAAAERMVEIHQGPPGDDGDSAYEIAVQEGFVGSKAEWLASLDGSDGTGIDEVEQTETSIANGGTNKVRITLTNGTYYDIQIKNGSSSNGLFPTSSALAAACPSPKVGDYAFVGDGFPADIYVCETAGTWTDSGEDFDGGNVDLTDYAKKAELTQLEHEVHQLSGRCYGVFEDAGDLPEGEDVGFALVGDSEPMDLYFFDGEDWYNTGIKIAGIIGPRGPQGIQGIQGIQGVPGVSSVNVSVDNGTGVPSVDVALNDGVLSLSFHNLKGVQGNMGSSVAYPFTLVNNVSDGGVTAALTAEMGKYLYDYINGASSELSIILTDYTPYDFIISSNNLWATQTGVSPYQGQCVLVPLTGMQKIKCSVSGGNGVIAFLKNSTMVGAETPAFSDSYPARISVINGDPAIEYVVPGDALYLYVNTRQANGTDLIPRYTIKQIEQSSGAIFFDKIADNLTTDNALRVLSAKQGVVLKGMIGAVDGKVDGLLPRVGGTLAGKKVSIIGDSISCFGTEAEVRNGQYTTPYFKILSTDVGQTIQSWVTWLDVYQAINNTTPTGKTIGGVALTSAMIGTKQTFTPVAEDVGKCIGVPRWAGAYTTKPWWQVLIEQTGMVFCGNASWSGGRVVPIPEGEERHDSFVLSEMYSEYTLGRVKGRADDGTEIIPDVILLYRGTNDFSAQDAIGVEGLETPDMKTFTGITDAHNFTQGYIWTILQLRALYPDAVIVLCTLNVFKRVNYSRFPTNNGTYTLPDYNNKIREIANLMGCGVIELDKDGITFENCYPTYINDSSTIPTHPNTTGHQVMGMKAVDDVKYYLP